MSEEEGHNGGPPLDDLSDRIAELAKLDATDILRLAHKKLLATLLAKLDAGLLTAAEAVTLRNLLKDNGMILGVPPEPAPGAPVPQPAPIPRYQPPEWEEE